MPKRIAAIAAFVAGTLLVAVSIVVWVAWPLTILGVLLGVALGAVAGALWHTSRDQVISLDDGILGPAVQVPASPPA